MRVAIMVHRFHPDLGGVEMTAQVIARGLAERHGDEIVVVTHTEDDHDDAAFPFRVVREPAPGELLGVVRGAEVVLHNNPCLQFWWPQAVTRTPIVMAIRQHVSLPGQAMSRVTRAKYHAKYALIEGADELTATSHHMATHLPQITTVIPNGYRDDVFSTIVPPTSRDATSLAYLGRLTEDKGVDLLVHAVALLAGRGTDVRLTVMGDGPERPALESLADSLGVGERIAWVGAVDGPRANTLLNEHAIAVVPSRVPEAFGTVALEAAAAGCVVVGADLGGLPEAIGPCGPLFVPDDAASLADRVEQLVRNPQSLAGYRARLAAHTAAHTQAAMVDGYREVLVRAAAGRGRNRAASKSLRGRVRRAINPWPPSV
ncbi:glycosyl transferase, group 1 family protein [Janibacter hoylei PVAS-1]|uniref:D-inositol 3-phosphate glycosyltransferase n=1 Tax=Janibacter hoylei PVAS-1 TaxID=1210046 RepID=K1ERX1_9MICO|nr:glycosyltransferase family 4 protein [Janibacter hoylei]EKA61948.1 glycosyl transferase, group 1 family protein [Janibacter hoylei PVAS-1]RWU84471.1 glycosyltransferase family 1 protein [Janibacter hoylei PVAS-1]